MRLILRRTSAGGGFNQHIVSFVGMERSDVSGYVEEVGELAVARVSEFGRDAVKSVGVCDNGEGGGELCK